MAEQHCLIVGFLGVFALDHDSKFHNNLVAHDKLLPVHRSYTGYSLDIQG